MNLKRLTRSAAIAVILAGLVTFLPGLRRIQVAEAAGAPLPLPLPRVTETAAPTMQDPFGGCVDRTRIVQQCALANLPGMRALEQSVIADLIAIHQLPPGVPSLTPGGQPALQGPSDTASRLLSWERDTLRTLLFDKIALIINKTPAGRDADEQARIDAVVRLAGRQPNPRTQEEQAIVDALATLVGQQRLAGATAARRFYNSWRGDPCTFEPPMGFSYARPTDCAIPNAISNIFSNPPSVEQFEAYGAYVAYERFSTDADLQAAAAKAARVYTFLGGLAFAGIAGAAATSFIASTAIGNSIALAILPFSAQSAAVAGAGLTSAQAAGLASAGALGTAVFIVVLAIAIAAFAGYTAITASEIPGKLDDAIAAARTPPNLTDVLASEKGKQEIYAAYLTTTVPPKDAPTLLGGLNGWAPVPAARPDDRKFLLDPGPAQQESAELAFRGWNGISRARLSQGWFVDQTVANAPALTLGLDYRNHANEQWTAWRIGDRFLHTTAGDTTKSFESDTILFQDPNAALPRVARILPATPAVTFTDGGTIEVTVTNAPPTFAGLPSELTVDQSSADGAVVSYPTPTATDDGGNPASVSCTPGSGSTFPVGRTNVTCTATPRYGPAATASFAVTVRETFCLGLRATIVPRPFDDFIVGTPGNDVIIGTPGNDIIYGRGGDDLICGLDGDDLIFGEGGDDRIYGDRAHGGEGGDDTLDGGEGRDELFGGPGIDRLLGGDGDDYLEDYEGASQTFDGGGGTNRCVGVRTAAPAGSVTNCQVRNP